MAYIHYRSQVLTTSGLGFSVFSKLFFCTVMAASSNREEIGMPRPFARMNFSAIPCPGSARCEVFGCIPRCSATRRADRSFSIRSTFATVDSVGAANGVIGDRPIGLRDGSTHGSGRRQKGVVCLDQRARPSVCPVRYIAGSMSLLCQVRPGGLFRLPRNWATNCQQGLINRRKSNKTHYGCIYDRLAQELNCHLRADYAHPSKRNTDCVGRLRSLRDRLSPAILSTLTPARTRSFTAPSE